MSELCHVRPKDLIHLFKVLSKQFQTPLNHVLTEYYILRIPFLMVSMYATHQLHCRHKPDCYFIAIGTFPLRLLQFYVIPFLGSLYCSFPK